MEGEVKSAQYGWLLRLDNERKLECAAVAELFVLVMLYCFFHFLGGHEHFMCLGPDADFIIFKTPIDTWAKYIALMIMIVITETIMVVIDQIASPIIKFNIYNPHVNRIEWIRQSKFQFLYDVLNTFKMFIELILIMMFLIKFDIMLLGVIVRSITRHFTSQYQMSLKYFDLDNNGLPPPSTKQCTDIG